MKKITALLLTILMIIVPLASCGVKIPNETKDTNESSESENVNNRITVPIGGQNLLQEESINKPISESKIYKFIAAGDNIIHGNIYIDAKNRITDESQRYNFLPMYDDISEIIANADISFVNQETLMGGDELGISGYPTFNSPQEAGDTLVKMGFDIVNIANNHMVDRYEKGLANTIDYWLKQPILLLGAFNNKVDFDNIRVYEKDELKIAFLSYTYGTNGLTMPSSSEIVIPYINNDDLIRQIELAKEVGDLVFVSVHWGNEDAFEPTAEQKNYAQIMADNGVDVVIGHHPHVVEPIKWIERSDGGKTLVIYSLGNLISTMLYGRNMVGGIMTFDIVKDGNEKPYVNNPLFIPTVTHYNNNSKALQVYQMENYTEELAKVHGCNNNDSNFSYAQAKKYITDTINAEFLPGFLKP